jgi:parvulin-like peptidyl-prolyl isomerase
MLVRSRRGGALLVAALILFLAHVASAADGEVVAKIGNVEVTLDEVRAYIATLAAQEQAALARDPGLLSQAVRGYLARRLVVKAAQAKSWEKQPAVKAQLDRARDETLAELYLQSVSQPPEAYPSDAEVQAAYDARPGVSEVPTQYRVAQIFVAASKPGDAAGEDKARARLDGVIKKLKGKDADFAVIARESSEERSSAESGGDIGWSTEAQLIPGVRATVLGLAKGAVSAPVRVDGGWHIMKLLDTRPASRRPLSEVRAALVAQLRAERAQANRRAYLSRLLDEAPPVINELALSALLSKPK